MKYFSRGNFVSNNSIDMNILSGMGGQDIDEVMLDAEDIKRLYFLSEAEIKEWIICLAKRLPKEGE